LPCFLPSPEAFSMTKKHGADVPRFLLRPKSFPHGKKNKTWGVR
jgi:hypothetical protein